MAIKFEKIKPGMVLYDRHRRRMGNTTMTTLGEWSVRIISVDPETRSATVSWNGNREERYTAHRLAKLYSWSMRNSEVCEMKTGYLGNVTSVRKFTKKELKERAEKKAFDEQVKLSNEIIDEVIAEEKNNESAS